MDTIPLPAISLLNFSSANFSCAPIFNNENRRIGISYTSNEFNAINSSNLDNCVPVAMGWTANTGDVRFGEGVITSPSIFHKFDLIKHEEIVLGLLSVFFVSLTSALVYDTILHQNKDGTYKASTISFAAALARIERMQVSFSRNDSSRIGQNDKKSLVFLFALYAIALATLSVDVALIAATQQNSKGISGTELGFQLVAPVLSSDANQVLLREVYRRPCAQLPIDQSGSWHINVEICYHYASGPLNFTEGPFTGLVSISSIYHSRGFEHNVSTTGNHFLTISIHPFISSQQKMKIRKWDSSEEQEATVPLRLERVVHGEEDENTARDIHVSAIGSFFPPSTPLCHVRASLSVSRFIMHRLSPITQSMTSHIPWPNRLWKKRS